MKRHTIPFTELHRQILASPEYRGRFWSYVDKTGECWIWKGARSSNGYGSARLRYRNVNAHRIAWEITNGPIGDDQWVLHTCESSYPQGSVGYRLCVRPDHLYLGSAKDNSVDMVRSGRKVVMMAKDHPTAVLDEASVLAIRVCYASGRFTQEELSSVFGVNRQSIGDVVTGRRWAWVETPDPVQRALADMASQRGPYRRTRLWKALAEGNRS